MFSSSILYTAVFFFFYYFVHLKHKIKCILSQSPNSIMTRFTLCVNCLVFFHWKFKCQKKNQINDICASIPNCLKRKSRYVEESIFFSKPNIYSKTKKKWWSVAFWAPGSVYITILVLIIISLSLCHSNECV